MGCDIYGFKRKQNNSIQTIEELNFWYRDYVLFNMLGWGYGNYKDIQPMDIVSIEDIEQELPVLNIQQEDSGFYSDDGEITYKELFEQSSISILLDELRNFNNNEDVDLFFEFGY